MEVEEEGREGEIGELDDSFPLRSCDALVLPFFSSPISTSDPQRVKESLWKRILKPSPKKKAS